MSDQVRCGFALGRAVAIQLRCTTAEFAGALAALDPPATEAEKNYLRDIVRRERAALRARASINGRTGHARDE